MEAAPASYDGSSCRGPTACIASPSSDPMCICLYVYVPCKLTCLTVYAMCSFKVRSRLTQVSVDPAAGGSASIIHTTFAGGMRNVLTLHSDFLTCNS